MLVRWIHSKDYGSLARYRSIAGEIRRAFHHEFRGCLHPPVAVNILHQIESPGHRKKWMKSGQGGDQRTSLDGTCMDKVRFHLLGHPAKIRVYEVYSNEKVRPPAH
jgi:hypothetical protein